MNALDCPACGGQLQPHVGSSESAPWLCNVNRLQFWDCELAPEFRLHYRPHLQDWGYGVHVKELRLARAVEHDEAKKRGANTHEHQLPILDIGQLNTLAGKKNLSKPFARAVSNEIAKRTSPGVVA